jgi:hypothetical protein
MQRILILSNYIQKFLEKKPKRTKFKNLNYFLFIKINFMRYQIY